jgi:eukaryotic-like serine/threonine-protein kinase
MSTNSQRLGKYELLERLGQGGMAEVWKARDTLLQRYVAIKILHANLQEDPNFITRFEREAQLIASLHHPNIVQIHDFQITRIPESTTPIAYMVMDYIEGGTLDEYIASTSARGKIPSPTQIVHLFTSMSLAIDYAHQQGMIHRDIKPANILLDKNNTTRNPMGEPILTDFGVAKLLGVTSSTLSASQLGTPLYVSPEQVRGYPGNERSDIYALGVILYEMVTGVPPFRGDTAVNVFTQHLNVTPTSPALINPSLPTALTLVILKALAKDPNERFASAASMTAAIAEALNMPVPESLGQAAYSQDEANMPTYLHSPWQLGTAPLPPSSTSGVDVINRAALHATPSAPSGGAQVYQVAPPRDGTAKTGDPQATPLPAMHSPSPPPSQQRRRWRTLYGVVAALIIIAVLGSAVLVFFLKYTAAQVSPALASAVVGHCFFVSSGQLNPDSAQGIADQLEIDLQNIPDPQSGKGYYAWLLPDRHPKAENDPLQPTPQFALPLLLTSSPLPVNHGRISFFYKGTAQHDNLFSLASRLLITEENANGAPHNPLSPGADRGTWRYYAEIPQTPYGTTSLSALDHIRHLFYKETRVEVLGLPGGLDIWLFRDTEKLVEWAVSARDDYNPQGTNANQMRILFMSILDYLDGAPNVHLDVPNGPTYADKTSSKVALLSVDPAQQQGTELANNPPGYLDHVPLHLNGVIKAPDATPEMRKVAAHIIDELNNSSKWLKEARGYARQLVLMGNNQLAQPQALTMINTLLSDVTYAYIGQLDPKTNTVVPGVLQAHYDVQQLASLTVTKDLPQTI